MNTNDIKVLDVVALTADLPKHHLHRGEIGTAVEMLGNGAFEVEFVAQDGHTYALVTLTQDQLIPLREKPTFDSQDLVRAKA